MLYYTVSANLQNTRAPSVPPPQACCTSLTSMFKIERIIETVDSQVQYNIIKTNDFKYLKTSFMFINPQVEWQAKGWFKSFWTVIVVILRKNINTLKGKQNQDIHLGETLGTSYNHKHVNVLTYSHTETSKNK